MHETTQHLPVCVWPAPRLQRDVLRALSGSSPVPRGWTLFCVMAVSYPTVGTEPILNSFTGDRPVGCSHVLPTVNRPQ